ncbi:hypothetical protein DFH11DRAFT_699446 [Phellopilus nigrolimitatus]|nr:hypothetical protein DFH11DRAFT_699446 [Phellopilus nigrolimitatus]
MPKIRSLSAQNFLPRSVFGDSLTSFALELRTDSEELFHWGLKPLLQFLISLRRLDDLTLVLGNVSFASEVQYPLILASLKTLELRVLAERVTLGLSTLKTLLASIEVPILTELTAHMDIDDWRDAESWISCLFTTRDNAFQQLTRFNASFTRFVSQSCGMDRILTCLPNLSHLSISAHDYGGTELWNSFTLSAPPLKSICYDLDKSFDYYSNLHALLYNLKLRQDWDPHHFEKVELINCASSDRQKLRIWYQKERLFGSRS